MTDPTSRYLNIYGCMVAIEPTEPVRAESVFWWVRAEDYDAIVHELGAYRRAKQENDQRFQIELDEAREEVRRLRSRLRDYTHRIGRDTD